jgi:hypothetical protein
VLIKQRLGDTSNGIANVPLAEDGRSFSIEVDATVGYSYYAELPPDPGYLTGDVKRRTGNSADVIVTAIG